MSPIELLDGIFSRPHMFCEHITSFKDVVVFAEGACHGVSPPHGSGVLPGFNEYLARQYKCSEFQSWSTILLSQFENQSLYDACDAARAALRGWVSTYVT